MVFLHRGVRILLKKLHFPQPVTPQEDIVKLPLISATIVAYTVLAAAWICYTELVALY